MVFNVEPLADFVDLVFVGDGEELIPEFLDRLKRAQARRRVPREAIVRETRRSRDLRAGAVRVERDARTGLLIPFRSRRAGPVSGEAPDL